MKSEIKNSVEEEYPCLKVVKGNEFTRNKGTVVLFSKFRKGTVVYAPKGAAHKLGYHGKSWAEEDFVPFSDKIELSND